MSPLSPAGGWENDGELTLSAHSLHAEDSDFGQAGTLYREVYDDAAKARFLDTITGAVGGVKNPDIKERAIQYWTNVDAELGAKLRANLGAARRSRLRRRGCQQDRLTALCTIGWHRAYREHPAADTPRRGVLHSRPDVPVDGAAAVSV